MGLGGQGVKPSVEILCDGNSKVGYGHIRRSMTLARKLDAAGFEVRISGLSAEAREALPPPRSLARPVRISIFDSLADISAPIAEHRAMGRVTLGLDCFSSEEPDVNVAIYPHTPVRAKQRTYVGFEYILVREEIQEVKLSVIEGGRGVLIVLGGGDLLGQGHQAAKRLAEAGCEVTLVQGPYATDVRSEHGYEVVVNPQDLPERMARAEWMVTNGGGCLFEALFLEKPVYVLPQTEAEERIAAAVSKRNALLGVGLNGLKSFASDELVVARARSSGVVDGRGAERISSIVEALA
ncbi:MAG: hypothetical protein V4760_08065 [Bdellovibrionota bacterium]